MNVEKEHRLPPSVRVTAALVVVAGVALGAVAVMVALFILRTGELGGPPAFLVVLVPALVAAVLISSGVRMFRGSVLAAERAQTVVAIVGMLALLGSIALLSLGANGGEDLGTLALIATVSLVIVVSLFVLARMLGNCTALMKSLSG
jgi:hypothetical protein